MTAEEEGGVRVCKAQKKWICCLFPRPFLSGTVGGVFGNTDEKPFHLF